MNTKKKLKFSVSIESCKSYNQTKAFTNKNFSIFNMIEHICSSKLVNKKLISSTHDNVIGRIDLHSSNIISIDFVISSKSVGERNCGFTLGGSNLSKNVWGNFWIIDMSVVTIFGKRNLVQSFKITLPMLSSYSSELSERSIKVRHRKLVLSYLDDSFKSISEYLSHFINRIEE